MTIENQGTAGIPLEEPARQKYFINLVRNEVEHLGREKGRRLTCFISTFGCPTV